MEEDIKKQEKEINFYRWACIVLIALLVIVPLIVYFQRSPGLSEECPYVNYAQLATWDVHPEWKFEHVWVVNSSYLIGIIDDERYVASYWNGEANQQFEVTFDFDGTCELLLYDHNCTSIIDAGCHHQYILNGTVVPGDLNF